MQIRLPERLKGFARRALGGEPLAARLRRWPAQVPRVLLVGRDALSCDQSPQRWPVLRDTQGRVDWSTVVASAQRELLTQRVQVVLDASICRFALLPWAPGLTSAARWTMFAASRFEQVFGESAEGWRLRLSDEMPPRARLLAAAPEDLMQSLESSFGKRLDQVRIELLENLGQLLAREPRYSGWLSQFGAEEVWLLALLDGALRRVRVRRLPAVIQADPLNLVAHLGPVLRAEWAALGSAQLPAIAVRPAPVERHAGAALAAIGAGRLVAIGGR